MRHHLVVCRWPLLAAVLALPSAARPARADESPRPVASADRAAAAGAADPSAPWTPDGAPFPTPYLYQGAGAGAAMSATVQYELGYGSRDGRNFAAQGVEQGVRARFQPWSFLGIEVFGGLVIDAQHGGLRGGEGSVEVSARALEQASYAVNLDVAAGYLHDYRGSDVPFARLTLGRAFGPLDLSLAGRLEIPIDRTGRDEVDIMTSVAASWGFDSGLRAGLEAAGEDLEGFWDPTEAEGGAKLLFGPTLACPLPDGFFVKANASAIYAYAVNGSSSAASVDDWGVAGRVVLGGTW